MYVAMATAVHMDYTLPWKQDTSFQMLSICAVYAIAYTSNLQKHEYSWNIAPSIFVLASYANTMALTSEPH